MRQTFKCYEKCTKSLYIGLLFILSWVFIEIHAIILPHSIFYLNLYFIIYFKNTMNTPSSRLTICFKSEVYHNQLLLFFITHWTSHNPPPPPPNVSMLLKPQDSFGEFSIFFLDLQKVQEIIRKHHQTFLQLLWMTNCNAILPSGKLLLCT